MKHARWAILTLPGALACVVAFGADDSAIRVDRCESLWKLTIEVEHRPLYRAELCHAGIEPWPWLRLESDENNHAPLWVQPAWQAQQLTLSLAEYRGGDVLWSAAADTSNSDWQPFERAAQEPFARLKLSTMPIVAGGVVQIDVVNKPSDQVLNALTRASEVKASASEPLKEHITLRFHAIDAATVIALIADTNDLTQTWDASGAITLRRARDAALATDLMQRIHANRQSEYDGDADAIAHADLLYAELHELVRVRNPKDLPPDATDSLSELAVRHVNSSNTGSLVALRRSMLALAQTYDARKDSRLVAQARANLAYALQKAGAQGEEDLDLLRDAEPVLLQSSQNLDVGDLVDQASALTRRGFARSAQILLERGFRPCEPDDALGWLLDSDTISWGLLTHYRDIGSSEGAAHVVAEWQRCIKGQTTLVQAVRIGKTRRSLSAGRFSDASAAYDLIFLRLPPLATLESSELNMLLEDALLAHLASGHYSRAAEILSLSTRVIKARAGLDPKRMEERMQAQSFVDALALAVPQPASIWDQRYRSVEPLALGGGSNGSMVSNWVNLEQAATMIVLSPLLDQMKGADLIALYERIAVLGFATLPKPLARTDAARYISKALALGSETGASPAQQQSRRLELEKLVEIAEEATP